MANGFIAMVFASLKENGIDTTGMEVQDAINKYEELNKSGGKESGKKGEPKQTAKATPEKEVPAQAEKPQVVNGYRIRQNKNGEYLIDDGGTDTETTRWFGNDLNKAMEYANSNGKGNYGEDGNKSGKRSAYEIKYNKDFNANDKEQPAESKSATQPKQTASKQEKATQLSDAQKKDNELYENYVKGKGKNGKEVLNPDIKSTNENSNLKFSEYAKVLAQNTGLDKKVAEKKAMDLWNKGYSLQDAVKEINQKEAYGKTVDSTTVSELDIQYQNKVSELANKNNISESYLGRYYDRLRDDYSPEETYKVLENAIKNPNFENMNMADMEKAYEESKSGKQPLMPDSQSKDQDAKERALNNGKGISETDKTSLEQASKKYGFRYDDLMSARDEYIANGYSDADATILAVQQAEKVRGEITHDRKVQDAMDYASANGGITPDWIKKEEEDKQRALNYGKEQPQQENKGMNYEDAKKFFESKGLRLDKKAYAIIMKMGGKKPIY